MEKTNPERAATKRPAQERNRVAKPIFLFNDYREFLTEWAKSAEEPKGVKSRLAEAANCQPSYLSQTLAGGASLSLDQAFGISRYLGLSPDEWTFFRELVILDRAATQKLRSECEERLQNLRKNLGGVVAAFSSSGTPPDRRAMAWYAESWQHGAVFVSLSSERARSAVDIAKERAFPLQRTAAILERLVQFKFATKTDQGYTAMAPVLYWQHGAMALINRLNWLNHGRHRQMEGYDRGLHLSGLAAMSKEDYLRHRTEILESHKHRLGEFTQDGSGTGKTLAFFGIDFFEA